MATSDSHGNGPEGFDVVAGLARIAVGGGLRTAGWAVQSSFKFSRRVVRAALSPEEALQLARDMRQAARDLASDFADVADVEQRMPGAEAVSDVAKRVAEIVPRQVRSPGNGAAARPRSDDRDGASGRSLREEG